jgi:hypothetical protein
LTYITQKLCRKYVDGGQTAKNKTTNGMQITQKANSIQTMIRPREQNQTVSGKHK